MLENGRYPSCLGKCNQEILLGAGFRNSIKHPCYAQFIGNAMIELSVAVYTELVEGVYPEPACR